MAGEELARLKEDVMDGQIIGLVAVMMSLGIPLAGMYTYYRVRKLHADVRLAAIAKGQDVPLEPELSQPARSRRLGILLTALSVGWMATFSLISRVEPDARVAMAFGAIPLALGIGFFVDFTLIRRDLRA
jgi:hypothetical protein